MYYFERIWIGLHKVSITKDIDIKRVNIFYMNTHTKEFKKYKNTTISYF